MVLLGIEITRDRPNRRLMLLQRQYILDMLERYGQADSTPVKTPMVPGTNLSVSMAPVSTEDKEYMKKVPYISAVDSLLFLALTLDYRLVYGPTDSKLHFIL